MCLFDPKKVSPLTEDIKVYKVLLKEQDEQHDINEDVVYRSPYLFKKWKLGERHSEDSENIIEEEIRLFGCIGAGVIHCYRSLQDAIDEKVHQDIINDKHMFSVEKPENATYVIAEFIIPKDSKYVYLGTFWHKDDCYGASDVIFNKIIL